MEGQPYSWESMDDCTANFTADVTPLILAAHRFIPGHNILLLRNHFEILKMLLDRGATIPVPHDVKVGRHPLPATPNPPCRLVALVETLQKRKLRHNKRPQSQPHALENITIALDAIQEDGIKLVNIGKSAPCALACAAPAVGSACRKPANYFVSICTHGPAIKHPCLCPAALAGHRQLHNILKAPWGCFIPFFFL